MSLINARLLDTAVARLTLHQNFSNGQGPPENLTPSDFKALKRLSKNKNIVIQQADIKVTLVMSAVEEIFNT